ncbi:MAG: NAD(P)-dependent dehydrogenase (short-subunit alcohol dehydrogenase family) [Paracoccaceae bacterium]|jgi:NAD(P)-dependent dehydrogenase (short-subunit alcohol dehydrogenase family)
MTRLAGKTAIITGAARGIGLAFATRYAAEGARVAITDSYLAAAERAAAGIGDAAIAVRLDVTDQAGIDAAAEEEATRLGHIDILINNAGFFDLAAIPDIPRAGFDKLFAVSVAGTLFTMQAVARHMITRGKGGRIINMASQAGRRGEALVGVYCATKAAGLGLIQYGINVNAIAPGVVHGPHWDHVDALFAAAEGLAPGEKKAAVGAAAPFGRMGTAEDLTGMAVFLASDDAAYVVAQTYNVDGGNWMN